MNLYYFKCRALCNEINRRTGQGPGLIANYLFLSKLHYYPSNNYDNSFLCVGVKKRSQREMALRYQVSDEELMREIQRRVSLGYGDAALEFQLLLKKACCALVTFDRGK